jgi:hypothetical protein
MGRAEVRREELAELASYAEPSDWASIQAASPGTPESLDTDLVDSDLFDKLHGGWLGRCIGPMVGKSRAEADPIDSLIMGLKALEDHGLALAASDSSERLIPYREDFAATTRADIWGYVFPGQPAKAAELAYRDAAGSHVKNGIYGALFSASMISAAFSISDVEEIVMTGLSAVPAESRLAEAIRNVIVRHGECNDWQETWSQVNDTYGRYDDAHAIPNICAIVVGLLWGQEDFETSVSTAARCGTDTGSIVATVGSLLGVTHESHELPRACREQLNDVGGNGKVRISELARRTLDVVRKLGTNP